MTKRGWNKKPSTVCFKDTNVTCNITGYKGENKKEGINMEKVVGTTFRQIPNLKTITGQWINKECTSRGVSELRTTARLIPEPANPYDSEAVAVYIDDQNGNTHHIGYLARESQLKKSISTVTYIDLTVYNYAEIGMNSSFVLGEITNSTFAF